ncbi:hypothetical protein GGP46_002988 [Salinibacter ruber]|nr:hypothetical protein [Salinibacter ruber]
MIRPLNRVRSSLLSCPLSCPNGHDFPARKLRMTAAELQLWITVVENAERSPASLPIRCGRRLTTSHGRPLRLLHWFTKGVQSHLADGLPIGAEAPSSHSGSSPDRPPVVGMVGRKTGWACFRVCLDTKEETIRPIVTGEPRRKPAFLSIRTAPTCGSKTRRRPESEPRSKRMRAFSRISRSTPVLGKEAFSASTPEKYSRFSAVSCATTVTRWPASRRSGARPFTRFIIAFSLKVPIVKKQISTAT